MKNIFIPTLVVFMSSGVLFAQDTSKVDREKMAVTHEKMALCLRSEKPLHECHEEMKTACKEHMGAEGCHMMDEGGMMKHQKGMKH